jgi:hypothetical protein
VPYLKGTITSSSKGYYYLDDYLVTDSTYEYTCNNDNSYYPLCGFYNWADYNQWIDYNSYESLMRFSIGLRIKFALDDLSTSDPTVLTNIPDQTPTVGFWT